MRWNKNNIYMILFRFIFRERGPFYDIRAKVKFVRVHVEKKLLSFVLNN